MQARWRFCSKPGPDQRGHAPKLRRNSQLDELQRGLRKAFVGMPWHQLVPARNGALPLKDKGPSPCDERPLNGLSPV